MTINKELFHYYGDIVRRLFMAAALIMLIGLPIFNDRLPAPLFESITAVIALGLFAGLTSPAKISMSIIDTAICIAGIFIFEYYAVQWPSVYDMLFWFNQVLALVFFAALYYSVKSWRARLLDK